MSTAAKRAQSGDGVGDMKVQTVADSRRSGGVSPTVAGASRSRPREVLTSPLGENGVEAEDGQQDGAGVSPRATSDGSVFTFMSRTHGSRNSRVVS
jgi:hypothetical protein